MKKHIAILCNYRLMEERIGGMDQFFVRFDRYCTAQGVKVDWFFPNTAEHVGYSELDIHPFGTQLEPFFLNHLKENKAQYDVIVTHFTELCTSFFKKIKQYSTARLIAVDHNPRPEGGYPLRKKITKILKGILYASYTDQFIGVSDYTSRQVIKDFGPWVKSKTITVYNGIDFNKIPPNGNRCESRPRFLTASHLRPSKGIQDLLSAVKLLPVAIQQGIVIDIYGEGPYEAHLRQMAADFGLCENISFKGSTALNSVYQHYDYMLQPTYMECFSLSILESLAANVPVITTPVGGNTECVRDNVNGYIFNPGDVKALSALLLNLYSGKMGIVADTRKEIEQHFSLDKMVTEHYEILNLN